jgi:hypothetical protein
MQPRSDVHTGHEFQMPPAPTGLGRKDRVDVADHGAVGDGASDDTDALNAAITAAAQAGGGAVHVGPGTFRCGTVRLRSHVHLVLSPAARIIGTDDPDRYEHYVRPADNPESQNDRWHRALILGQDVEDVTITGGGTIDGAHVFDPRGEERMRGPHTVLLGGCRKVRLDGITFDRSANYAVLVEYSEQLEFRHLRFRGGWDGIHARGMIGKPCRDIIIHACDFQTGDDAIAGRYWDHVLIKDCLINSSCNGVRVIGPAEHLTIDGNLFYAPGRHPHITQGRYNSLAGILIQPGAWDACPGPTRDIRITHNTMTGLQCPLALRAITDHPITRVAVERLTATDTYGSAIAIEGAADQPLGEIRLHDVSVDYTASASLDRLPDDFDSPGKGVRQVPAWGLFANHVQSLELDRLRLQIAADDPRQPLVTHDVDHVLDHGSRFTVTT